MNADILKFWRYIQRFSFGALFFGELLVLSVGQKETTKIVANFTKPLSSTTSVVTSAILIFIIILISGAVGALLLDIIVDFFSFLSKQVIFRIKYFKKYTRSHSLYWFSILIRPAYELAIDLLQENLKKVLSHLELRSLSEPDFAESNQVVQNYYKRLKKYIQKIDDYELFSMLGFETTLTQEQRAIENLRWDISNIFSFWLILVGGVIIVLVWTSFSWPNILLGLIFLLSMIFMTGPYLYASKKELAYFLLSTYAQIYMLAEGAELADRDTI